MTYRIRSDLQATASDREAHVRALTGVTSSDERQDVFDHLYACLTILDSKSASLLGFNSIITAVFAIFLTQRLTAAETFVANLGMAAVLVSAMLLLTVLWIRWATTGEIADGGEYASQLLRVRNDRTVRFRVAWYFAIVALVALVLLLIFRVSAGAAESPPRAAGPVPIATAYRNHLPIAALLIERGADVNAKDDTVQSAYLIATSEGYVELLRLTLRAGADVNLADSRGVTPLAHARQRGYRAIVEILTRAGAR